MLTVLSILIVLLFISLVYLNYKDKSVSYDFESPEKVDLPYISIDIQGHTFNMITDSAASVSIIKKEALDQLVYEVSPRKINLSAITNDSIAASVVTVPLSIKDRGVEVDFVVYDNTDIADFECKYGIKLHGILGVEFFKKTKGIINFKEQSVTLS